MLTCAENSLGHGAKRKRPVSRPRGAREQGIQVRLERCLSVPRQPFQVHRSPCPQTRSLSFLALGSRCWRRHTSLGKPTCYSGRPCGVRGLEGARSRWKTFQPDHLSPLAPLACLQVTLLVTKERLNLHPRLPPPEPWSPLHPALYKVSSSG